MFFFVSKSAAPQVYRLLKTKEELLKEISDMLDKSLESGCTYFDLHVDTDASCFSSEV